MQTTDFLGNNFTVFQGNWALVPENEVQFGISAT